VSVKPPRFTYHDPATLPEALATVGRLGADAKVLAGGQSLIPLLNLRMAHPKHLVDLNRIAELAYLQERDGGLAIGAMTRHRAAERSPLVRERWPLLAQAVGQIGHVQIRSRGTIGGSIAHADPAAELPAVLAALDGHVTLVGPAGRRAVKSDELFVTYLTTSAAPDELLTEVWLPATPPRTGQAWLELARRHGDYALVGLGACLTLAADGSVADARLALTGVGPTPVRARTAEERLRGERPAPTLFAEAARLVAREVDPETDIHATADYRRHVAGILALRALERAARGADGVEPT
jgi:aerobic carbon-monoxide dehydrogenase medium subunit